MTSGPPVQTGGEKKVTIRPNFADGNPGYAHMVA